MLRKTTIVISTALVLGVASTASALPGRDSDNNPFPSGRDQVARGAPGFIGGNVFAGPRFAKRHARIHTRHMHRSY